MILVFLSSALAVSCAAPNRKSSQAVSFTREGDGGKKAMTLVELQESMQRFCANFSQSIAQAGTELYESQDNRNKKAVLRQVMLYLSSALDIATEPQPEIALLDMLVFITLSKETFESYWTPKVFGPTGKGIDQVFRQFEPEIWSLAGQVMSSTQQDKVKTLIGQWQKENPDQYKVEGVRLSEFATKVGVIAEAKGDKAGGLLAQRMPIILRTQARLLTQEILEDLNAPALFIR